MRSTLRSITFGLAAVLAGTSLSQSFHWAVEGSISGCYPGQTVEITITADGNVVLQADEPVDPGTCTFGVVYPIFSTSAQLTVSTQCNGMMFSLADTATFNFLQDTAFTSVTFVCAGGDPVDCNNVVNGPAMPGTPCDDGNPQTVSDTWTPFCTCYGVAPGDCWTLVDWQQVTNGGSPVPFEVMLNAYSSGAQPITYSWYFGNPFVFEGTSSTPSWLRTFAPGETMACQVIAVDANGCESQWANYEGLMNCDGIMGSPNWPGLPCTVPGTTLPGTWSADCICAADTTQAVDCEGDPGGNAWPGTACLYTNDNGNTWETGVWSLDCVCGPDSSGLDQDCAGVFGGSALPGTPCTIPGTVLEGTWSADCVCIPNNTDPCEANFWVIQAMGPDSLPVPYELWVWNLSNGGTGNFAFTWNFGDGSTSSQPFPSHTYSGNGPYNLCLTIMDSNGCTDTHCDSISINGDGIYEGIPVHDLEDRQDGFTLNVQNANANAVADLEGSSSLAMWPNPAADELNVAVVSTMQGNVIVTITDLDGRTVKNDRMNLVGGRSQLRIATDGLNAGMYLLRISDGNTNLSQRFVKAD
jgi:PKD domain/Secretion system C-terminal sorting domain